MGVTFDKNRNKWYAQAKNKGINHYLGRFDLKEDAQNAVNEFRKINPLPEPKPYRSKYEQKRARGGCGICGRLAIENRSVCQICKDKIAARKLNKNMTPEAIEKRNKQAQERHRIRRFRVIQHYGGKCQCCGEAEIRFLTIDHIGGKGVGANHRKRIGSGSAIAQWLITNNFPEGFQVLCFNCNCASGIYGVCPHVTLHDAI